MGNAAKRQAVWDLINTGDFVYEEGLETIGGGTAPSGPLDQQWLDEIRESRRRLAADPAGELPHYKTFFKKSDLTVQQVDQLLEAMEKAVGDPEGFCDEIVEEQTVEGIGSSVLSGLGCAIKIPKFFPTRAVQKKQEDGLQRLRSDFSLGDVAINPNDHHFEFCDPGWWPLLRQGVFDITWWPKGLEPFLADNPGRKFVYGDTRSTKQIALLSDFGVGQYHSHLIARQLETKKYPYVFHLGDVYYGGTEKEFEKNYTSVLDRVMDHSLLFSMPENHELYSGGKAYQKFLRTESQRGRVIQDGSYFCVRYAKHQVIGLDVNWNGRSRFAHEASRHWLRDVLLKGKDLTTILLTGSAPYCYGSSKPSKLYEDLEEWHKLGLFHMWFWGDDHYCALFSRQDNARFVGSCIGHGGYPGEVEKEGKDTFAKTDWVETASRFPSGYGLRDDLGNNGWVELTMLDDGGVELLYVDWLGCKRLLAKYRLDSTNPHQRFLELSAPPKKFERVHAFP